MLKFLVLPYLIFEFLTSWAFIEIFGILPFKFELMISALVGILVLIKFAKFKNEGLVNFSAIFTKFGLIIAGILLIFPGILGDIFGILILFAPHKNSQNNTQNFTKNNADSDIIDVEIIEESK